MRWSQLMFTQGFGSRRECAGLLAAGRVACAGYTVDAEDDIDAREGLVFEVDGKPWPFYERALLLLHKPGGVECSQKPRHHPSVLSLLPAPLRTRGVQPIGRLDADTTGVLLLTDDGALIHRLTSPKRHVPKVYEVQCDQALDEVQLRALREGVVLDDDPRPVRAASADAASANHLRLTLTEGKYHQVKRMVAAAGNHVVALHRSTFGAITLDGLAVPGAWRWIGSAERDAAFAAMSPTMPA